jgi:uncharacterized membrane protein YkgB
MMQKIIGSCRISPLTLLRISVGVIYLWFGALKLFPGFSPAESLAIETIHKLTFGLIDAALEIKLLATWECILGASLIIGKWMKPTLLLFFVHMICTFAPLFFFPDQTFRYLPYGLSLVGQYIIKNIVIVSAGLVLWQSEKEKSKRFVASTV